MQSGEARRTFTVSVDRVKAKAFQPTRVGHSRGMETTRGADPDRPGGDRDMTNDEGREMPPEPVPSPGEIDRERLGDDDVAEQAP